MSSVNTTTKNDFKNRKIVQVLGYLLRLCYEKGVFCLDKIKLIKMVWLADRINIRRNATTITGDNYYAMPFGPVASYTLDLINNHQIDKDIQQYAREFFDQCDGGVEIKVTASDFEYLSEEEKQNLQKSFDILYPKDSRTISDESHKFPEWSRYEEEREKYAKSSYLIKKEDFFDDPKTSNLLSVDSSENKELVALNKELFLSNPLAE